MDSYLAEVGWTEDQWGRIATIVAEEAQRARVATQFIPVVGPADPTAESFADFRLTSGTSPFRPPQDRIVTNNIPDHRLTTIAVPVYLKGQEVADTGLEAALVKFRRASNIAARVEDALVFNDRLGAGPLLNGVANIPDVFKVTGGGPRPGDNFELGLLPTDVGGVFTPIAPRLGEVVAAPAAGGGAPTLGNQVANAIIRAMTALEATGQSGPFACVLCPAFYEAIYNLNANFVAARDRILPILNGPILRSSAISNTPPLGAIVALGGSPVALRVTVDLCVRYLQATPEPRYLFRVSERLGLRITDPRSIVVLHRGLNELTI
jgi:uncharacterized linocin/CFP29 family protein